MSSRVEVVSEKFRPTSPELQYHRENVDSIRSYSKAQRERKDKALDTADFHLSRKKYRPPNGVTRKRIWPPAPGSVV